MMLTSVVNYFNLFFSLQVSEHSTEQLELRRLVSKSPSDNIFLIYNEKQLSYDLILYLNRKHFMKLTDLVVLLLYLLIR